MKRNVIIFHFLVDKKSSGVLKFLRLDWFEIAMFRRKLLSVNDSYYAFRAWNNLT